MKPRIERANRALFEGDRSAVTRLLDVHTSDAQELWLLAAAAENDKESYREFLQRTVVGAGSRKAAENDEGSYWTLLQRVVRTGQPPYANMAQDILTCEQDYAAELEKAPAWQTRLLAQKNNLIRLIITLMVISATILIINFMFPPSQPLAEEFLIATATAELATAQAGATQTVIALTPTATPTVTPLAVSARMEFWPVGALRILNIEYATERAVSLRGNQPVEPPAGSSFLAIRYEFTCGTEQPFCDDPPMLPVFLQTDNGEQIPHEGYNLLGVPPIGSVTQNSTGIGWLVFRVPDSLRPISIMIQVEDETGPDGTQTPVAQPTLLLPRQ